ncbi:hypothetical protein ACFFSH_02390 [Streptomyces filamentosus]|uniref:Uncharacterized protein n=1 Tax=Streptomyces filamentosus TaxID=67294 RepID=A0A919BQ04_STRFL|nr:MULTISPECIES: hypothetical protein [Streptomyces]GHG01821.1 hypothetical protein GCM10017667_36790 [Streptomyces filamentosus]
MSNAVTEQQVAAETEVAVELPEATRSQLVFDHGAQVQPHICPSAGARAA